MRRAAAVFVVALLLSGCRPGPRLPLPFLGRPSPTSTEVADPQREVVRRTVVEPLAKAIRSGETTSVQSLVHPDLGSPEQRDLFDPIAGARGFNLSSLSMKTKPDVIPITGSSAFIDIDGLYSVEGLKARLNFRAKLAVKKHSGKWLINGVNWTNAPPWIVAGPFLRTNAESSIVVHPSDFPAGQLIPLIREAHARLTPKGVTDSDGHLIAVASNSDDFHRIGGGVGSAVVITYYEWNGKRFSVKAPFLLLNPDEFAGASPDLRRLMVLHEMTHLGLVQRTTPFVPGWLSEGLAMHYSDDLPLGVFKQDPSRLDSVTLTGLTKALDLETHDLLGHRATIEYAFSAATVSVLIEQHGEDAVLDLLSSYQDAFTVSEIEERIPIFSTGGTASRLTLSELGAEATDRLLKKKFSTSTAVLDSRVKDWIRSRIG